MKQNLSFYQHFVEADQHPKFKMLRVQYGWAGEGKFWALNNRIAMAEMGWLDISKKYNKATFAADLEFNFEEFDEFIRYLHEECELLIFDDEKQFISTETVQENLENVMKEREASRNRKNRKKSQKKTGSPKPQKSSPEPNNNSPDQNNKGKESKVKENKRIPLPQVERDPENQGPPLPPDPDPPSPPSGFSSKKKNSYPVFDKGGNGDYEQYFQAINSACEQIGRLPPKRKKFSPEKWAQSSINARAHPGAVAETIAGLPLYWETTGDPWGWCEDILSKKNGNWNEQDAIAIHEKLKAMKPDKLSGFTHGLFQEMP
ncbi:hypothetical protein [Desulfospira joergensenii]|uniref:hypothetical protein n=1 Tax=Desulfospira joergensenii TaxID=53329 RepID=UPI0003B30465|nr:hypothetical protein [Desulfospira joergensenii]